MDVEHVLHMTGGIGDTSYANNSSLQKKVISLTSPIVEKAIAELYSNTFPNTRRLAVADLGCSSGPNTLFVVSELITVIATKCREFSQKPPELQVYLNDLPWNDFNTIFHTLTSFEENARKQFGINCFMAGVPGTFYGRLFAAETMHFVHSSYSLHWLSQVPQGLEENKGNIYLSSTSPPSVIKAYLKQFQNNFGMFLRCRSEEMVAGGRMVLTFLGRRSEDPTGKVGCYIWDLLAVALNQMVSERIIEESKLDSFNLPLYTPSQTEVRQEFEKEGSFVIDYLEVSQVHWYANDHEELWNSKEAVHEAGHNVAWSIRVVTESMLASTFGEGIVDEVFRQFTEIVSDHMSKEKTEYTNLTISATKK